MFQLLKRGITKTIGLFPNLIVCKLNSCKFDNENKILFKLNRIILFLQNAGYPHLLNQPIKQMVRVILLSLVIEGNFIWVDNL